MTTSTPAMVAAMTMALVSGGCGAIINGPLQTLEVRAADPKAEILANGTVIGTGKATLTGSPAGPPVIFVRDEQGGLVRYQFETGVSAAAIILDILCSLTIVGVAAPISDAMLDTFRYVDEPEQPIVVKKPEQRAARAIEYAKESAFDAALYAR